MEYLWGTWPLSRLPIVSGDVVSATSGVQRTVLLSSHLNNSQDCIEEALPKCEHLLLFETTKEIRAICTALAGKRDAQE